jgi:SAM-dependent methyltransferase
MAKAVHEIKHFYSQRRGRMVRRLLSSHIRELWPDLKGARLMGCGYALPYLKHIARDTERNFAFMPQGMGVHYWPEGEKGRVFLGDETDLPLETESLDFILLIHGLEFFDKPSACFHELWRVLKSNGRLIVVVPNRLGFWARSDTTPFGHGRPYSVKQITNILQDNLFVHERTERALFMPPFKSFLLLRMAYMLESLGRYVFSGFAGVHIVEASKQIYAAGTKSPVRSSRRMLIKNAVPTR